MVTNDGWVKLFRKARQWEWYKVENMFHLFCHLLMGANQQDGYFQGKVVKRGQLITGFNSLSADTGISMRALRTCFERLKKSGEISVKATNRFSIVTICKYDDYNETAKKNDMPNDTPSDKPAVTQPTRQTTTNKNTITINSNSKEIRGSKKNAGLPPAPPKPRKKSNEELKVECEIRQGEFRESLRPFVERFGREMVTEFYNYWRERNKSGTKMKFEQQRTWETKLRLLAWKKRDEKWKKPVPDKQEIDPNLQKLLSAHI